MTKPEAPRDRISLRKQIKQRTAQVASLLNPRERVGDFLNALEENRALRIKCFVVLVIVGGLVLASFWLWPRWRENSSIAVARQWVAAGKFDRAGEAVEAALTRASHRVEAWQVAAEYARQTGLRKKAVAYRRQAAALKPGNTLLVLDWAAEAVAMRDFAEAENALAKIPPATRSRSARAERLTGEIARQRGELSMARRHFESAVRLGGAEAENQIPLGSTLLGSEVAADRDAGLAMLTRWRNDPIWGLEALRVLLADAMTRNDQARLPELATTLIAHPGRERADTFNSLLALEKSDAARFAAALSETQRAWAADPGAVAELVAWLSGVGHGAEALRWSDTLPRELITVPPVAVALADARRVAREWAALRDAVKSAEWGEVDFLRQAYQMMAERSLGEKERAEELWRGLRSITRLKGGRALFLAGTLYSWGCESEAIELWWLATAEPGVAVAALGSLARHFQVQRDAEGLYQAFRRLNELKSADPRIANNYAYFAALTGRNFAAAERITQANCEMYPNEVAYLTTRAFVLHRVGKADAALEMIARFEAAAKNSPAGAFTVGLVLADAGRNAEARALLANVDERALTLREVELLTAARSTAAEP